MLSLRSLRSGALNPRDAARVAQGQVPAPTRMGAGVTTAMPAAPGPAEREAAPAVDATKQAGAGKPLSNDARELLETVFGSAVGDVRVHEDVNAVDSAQQMGAKAFTVGQQIFGDAAALDPRTPDGLRRLAEEVAHAVQAGGSATSVDSLRVDPASSTAEREAKSVSEQVVEHRFGQPNASPRANAATKERQREGVSPLRRASQNDGGASTGPRQEAAVPSALRLLGGANLVRMDRDPVQSQQQQATRRRARTMAQRVLTAVQGMGTDEQAIYRALAQPPEMVRMIRDIYDAEFNRHTGNGMVADIVHDMSDGRIDMQFAVAQLNRAGIATPGVNVQYIRQNQEGTYEGRTRIVADPAMPVAMPGSRITYRVDQGPGISSAGSYYSYRWYCLNDAVTAEARGSVARYDGPTGYQWEGAEWDFAGNHKVICRVQFHPQGERPRTPEFIEYQQVVLPTADVLDRAFQRTPAAGDPQANLDGMSTYLQVLRSAAQHPDSAALDQRTEEQLSTYVEKLGQRLESTEGSQRIGVRAVHVAPETGQITPLQVFVARVGSNSGRQTWKVVDVTNPVDRRLTGEYTGRGATAEEAIQQAINDWDSDNRYPQGLLRVEVPTAAGGRIIRRQFQTDGQSFWDSIAEFFDSVGLIAGIAALAAGIITAIAPVPGSRVVSGLIWTSIIASTTGAAIHIAQRHAEGMATATEDALDVLTIAGNLLAGGSMWARGARVAVGGAGGTRMLRGFIIGQFVSDGGQGIILGAQFMSQYEQALRITDPKRRTDRVLEILRSASVAGAVILLSMSGSRAELRELNGAGVDLRLLNNPGVEIDLSSQTVRGANRVMGETRVQPAATPEQRVVNDQVQEAARTAGFTPENGTAMARQTATDEAFVQNQLRNMERLSDTEQLARDMRHAGVSEEAIQAMLRRERPLCFADGAQWESFRSELETALRQDGFEGTIDLGLSGTSTSFYSNNPSKPGHYYDRLAGQGDLADIDININGPQVSQRLRELQSPQNQRYNIFKTDEWVEVLTDNGLTAVANFKRRWETLLGREVNLAPFIDNARPVYAATDYLWSIN